MSIDATREDLLRVIGNTFGQVTYPGDDALIEPGPDGAYRETLVDTWRGRTWRARRLTCFSR